MPLTESSFGGTFGDSASGVPSSVAIPSGSLKRARHRSSSTEPAKKCSNQPVAECESDIPLSAQSKLSPLRGNTGGCAQNSVKTTNTKCNNKKCSRCSSLAGRCHCSQDSNLDSNNKHNSFPHNFKLCRLYEVYIFATLKFIYFEF